MEEKENENGEKEMVETEPAKEKVKIKKRPVSLSDIHPLWTKHPNECSDEDYLNFYRKVFMDYKEPLFWIHLLKEQLSYTTTRYLSRTISKKSFRNI